MRPATALFGLIVIAAPLALYAASPTSNPAAAGHTGAMTTPDLPLTKKAKVIDVIDTSKYTYIEVELNKKKLWLAASALPLKKGEVIRFDDGMVMTNFHSKALNRTFPSITFVNRVVAATGKE